MADVQEAPELVARFEADLATMEAEFRLLIERHGAVLLKAAKKSPNGRDVSRAADPLFEDRRKIELRREALVVEI